MSLQRTAQALSDLVATELNTDVTAGSSVPLHEVTCLGVIAVVAATAMDIAAYDVASGAAALAVTTLSV